MTLHLDKSYNFVILYKNSVKKIVQNLEKCFCFLSSFWSVARSKLLE